ncbi:hypothetical protein [Chryseobacterium indoltheticum]|uniref:hypothetical protein n=1 Tax=Chryseobacterium indoltheticum TaxID=254 RepID=UPI003F49A6F0
MNILFTKNIDPKYISEKLGNNISVDCIEVIKTKSISVEPFDLKNRSLIFTSSNGVKSFFENRFQPNEDFTRQKLQQDLLCRRKNQKRAPQKRFRNL